MRKRIAIISSMLLATGARAQGIDILAGSNSGAGGQSSVGMSSVGQAQSGQSQGGQSAVGLSQSGPSQASGSTASADPGREINVDQGSLSSRAGPNATGSDKVFGATIGSTIYSEIGRPIGTSIGPR